MQSEITVHFSASEQQYKGNVSNRNSIPIVYNVGLESEMDRRAEANCQVSSFIMSRTPADHHQTPGSRSVSRGQ